LATELGHGIEMRKEIYKGLLRVYLRGHDREVVLDQILSRCCNEDQEEQTSRQTITRLFYGSLRFQATLFAQAETLRKGFTLPRDLQPLLAMTVYQLSFMDSIPDYAAVNEALNLIPRKYSGLKGFFTWILREFQRRPELTQNLSGFLPPWYQLEMERVFTAELIEDWKERLLKTPRTYFYLDHGSVLEQAEKLTESFPCYGISELSPENHSKILREHGVICDPLSMLIPWYFSDLTSGSFLDLCAAPGGKFLVAAARFPSLKMVAIEKSKRRFDVLKQRFENFEPLGRGADLHCMDALDFLKDCAKTGRKFERILLDAPCTALGTVLSHPEYLLTKTEKTPHYLTELQENLLSGAAATLSDKGEILYVVCTFRKEETEQQIQKVSKKYGLESHPLRPVAGEKHHKMSSGAFLLPGVLGNQIFYVSHLKKSQPISGTK
jgi:16S rRNA (cytosine967-C5)-methyltransferase